MNPPQTPPWWQTFYDDNLADMLLEQTTAQEIARTADFLVRTLELTGGESVLDQCCGSGRLAWEMADRGFAVQGIDLIPSYIERARGRRSQAVYAPGFAVADAFEFRADPASDAAFNWWTSFGYAETDAANQVMLRRAWESLRPGGRYALDFMNVPGLYRSFQPHVVTRCRRDDGEVVLVRESSLDLAAGTIRKRWTYFLPSGKQVVHHTAVRLYDPPTLHAMFEGAGFADIAFVGDTDGSPLTLSSPRCIVTARKP